MSRLYYTDAYLRDFEATIIETQGVRAFLDRSAFYPASGGQPHDLGSINGIPILSVEDTGDGRVAHIAASPLAPGPATASIDWPRRFDHMQQHTGQHLLSAVFAHLHGYQTLSFHLGVDSCTIDLETPSLTQRQIEETERRANELVFENRPVTVAFEDAASAQGLRKASERSGEIRIVTIADLDRSACGGTHVRATGEIGPILIRKLDKIRSHVRVEFVCGLRAIAKARADFHHLSAIAKSFSATFDETPALVATALENAREAAKLRKKLGEFQGRALHAATPESPDGLRRHIHRGAITEDLRAQAQAFISLPKAVFLAISPDPPSILLAASKDSGVNAGAIIKQAVARGGGSPQIAQGSVAAAEDLAAAEQRITADWPKNFI